MKDYHLHSGMLDHTDNDLEEIVKTAVDLGFTEIAITEHLIWPLVKNPRQASEDDHDTLFPNKELIPNDKRKTTDLFDYFNKIDGCQKKYSIKILKGLEVDYFAEFEDEVKECLAKHEIDIILGSCHYISNAEAHLPIDKRYLKVARSEDIDLYLKKYSEENLYSVYFQNILSAIKSKMFDYVAHLDFLKRGFKNYDYSRANNYLTPVLAELIKNDVGLEINVSGLKHVGETYPAREVINSYIKMGGNKISIGSDAHSVSRMKKMTPIINDLSKIYPL